MSKRQQSPQSQHGSSATQQGTQAPATQDAGVAQAEQVGNAATQEAMQGEEQTGAEGAMDWVVDTAKGAVEGAMDAVENWGLEQLTSVDAVITYVETVGLDAAMTLVMQLSTELVEELVRKLAGVAEHEALFWALADWLMDFALLQALPGGTLARVIRSAIEGDHTWVIDALRDLEGEAFAAILELLDESGIAALMDVDAEMIGKMLDAYWPPGVGITMEVDAEFAAGVVIGAGGSATLRNNGGGEIEGSVSIRGMAGGEVGVGEDVQVGNTGTSKIGTARLGADGEAVIGFTPAQLASWEGGRLLISTGMGANLLIANVVDELFFQGELLPLAEMITSIEYSGSVFMEGEGECTDGLAGVQGEIMGSYGAALRMTNIQGEGDRATSADFELELNTEQALELSGSTLEIGEDGEHAVIPTLDVEGEAAVRWRVRFHLDVTQAPYVSGLELEQVNEVEVGGVGVETSLEIATPEGMEMEDLLDAIHGCSIRLTIPVVHELFSDLMQCTPLAVLVKEAGIELEGNIQVGATMGPDVLCFLVETITQGISDPAEAVKTAKAWLTDPFGPELGDAASLFAMELAQAADLEVKLATKITLLDKDLCAKVAEVLTFGAELEVGVALDYETDLLDMGATPTMSDIQDLIDQAGGQVEALAAK